MNIIFTPVDMENDLYKGKNGCLLSHNWQHSTIHKLKRNNNNERSEEKIEI